MSVPYYGDFPEDHTKVIIPFNAFTSDDPSASATITEFINTDVHIHKEAGVAPRNNAAGITVSVDHDGITGNHVVVIDTNDDTVGGFWVTGKEYQVRIEGTVIDAATINSWIGSFSIERAGGVLALLKGGTVQVDLITINTIATQLQMLMDVTTTVAADDDLTGAVVDASVLSHLMTPAADTSTYDCSTDSLEAIKAHADTIKAETALIVEDTNELQGDDYPTSIGAVQTTVDAIEAIVDAAAAGADIAADIIAIKAVVDAIPQTAMRGTDSAALESVCTEARLAELDEANLPTDVAACATPAEVNTQVLDVLNTDTFAEPGDEVPTSTTTLVDKIGYIYKFLRNKIETTATRIHVYNDAGANKDQSSIISDDDTTFTRGEFGAGDA